MRVTFRRLLGLEALLFSTLYVVSLVGFVRGAQAITARFAALAAGPYLMTSVVTQLRLMPAYALLALGSAFLVWPWVQRGRFVVRFALAQAVVSLAGVTAALLLSPGFFDGIARRAPLIDLFAAQRFGLLHLGALVLLALFVRAVLFAVPSSRVRLALASVAVLALASAMVKPSPAKAKPLKQKNVLVIAADSWRFDRVGVHGAARADLTPHIDAFAKGALDFRSHHVPTASTLESWASFLTALQPSKHGLRSMYPSRAEVESVQQRELLTKRLGDAGFETFVSSDWAGNCFDLVDFGFQRTEVGRVQNFGALLREASVEAHPVVPLFFASIPGWLGDALVPGRQALAAAARPSVLVDRVFDGIDQSVAREKPFFGVVFFSSTHLPYNARPPFNVKYLDPAYDGPNRYHVEIDAHSLITTGFAPTLSPAAVQHVRDLYDGAVSDFDDEVGVLLAGLEARGLMDETVVVLTSDHGEDLYEPGSTVGHGTNFFGGDQSTRIPLFIRAPGVAPRQIDALTRSLDVAPTLLELLSLPPLHDVDGVSLLPLMRGERDSLGLFERAETCYLFFPKAHAMLGLTESERAEVVELQGAADTLEVDPTFRDNLVLREAWRQKVIDAKDRMVRTDRWKLIEIPGKTRPIRRLYDLLADPAQQHDLAGQGLPEEEGLAALLSM
ncbi:MAG: sulfatase-like hydrolase/transferase [Myxococcaceae bacterium]